MRPIRRSAEMRRSTRPSGGIARRRRAEQREQLGQLVTAVAAVAHNIGREATLRVGLVARRATLQQARHQLGVPPEGGAVQRGLAPGARGVGAALDEMVRTEDKKRAQERALAEAAGAPAPAAAPKPAKPATPKPAPAVAASAAPTPAPAAGRVVPTTQKKGGVKYSWGPGAY